MPLLGVLNVAPWVFAGFVIASVAMWLAHGGPDGGGRYNDTGA